MIRLLLRSFVLIQSSPKGFWVNVCVCVPTFPLSFPYFVPVILFSLTICFSLVPSLLAAYQPPTNTGKPMQVHANTHTHTKKSTIYCPEDGGRCSACTGCQVSWCRGDILVNELQKNSSHLVSTVCVCRYVCLREKINIKKKSQYHSHVFPLMSVFFLLISSSSFLPFKVLSLVETRQVGGQVPECLHVYWEPNISPSWKIIVRLTLLLLTL